MRRGRSEKRLAEIRRRDKINRGALDSLERALASLSAPFVFTGVRSLIDPPISSSLHRRIVRGYAFTRSVIIIRVT